MMQVLATLYEKLTGKYWWQILAGFLLGVLCGHFWWRTTWTMIS
jgi:Na+/H+-dicarboxylate symporter